MKPINLRYHNLDKPTVASSVTWDMINGSEIVVNDLITTGNMGSTKEDLDAMIQEVIQGYEVN